MNASKRQYLGCQVTDSRTGESLGRVASLVFDPQGENVTEILVTSNTRQRPTEEDELEERLFGRLLFDAANQYLGEITDALVGARTGSLKGVIVERTPQHQELIELDQGLQWREEHWVVPPEHPGMISTMFAAEPAPAGPVEAADDWMVGQVSTVRLLDRRGQVIIEPGQRITPSVVEQASRAGVLHKLEAEFTAE